MKRLHPLTGPDMEELQVRHLFFTPVYKFSINTDFILTNGFGLTFV